MEKTIQDGTASFAVRDKRIKALVDLFFPVGTIISRDDGNEPEILKYGKWEKIAEGRVLQGAGGGVTGEAGQDVEPGLPNITGTFGGVCKGNVSINNDSQRKQYNPVSGAFYDGGTIGSKTSGARASDELYWNLNNFDASKSNPIYGASETVQPPAHIVVFWKRIE